MLAHNSDVDVLSVREQISIHGRLAAGGKSGIYPQLSRESGLVRCWEQAVETGSLTEFGALSEERLPV